MVHDMYLFLACGFCRMAAGTSLISVPLCAWLLPRLLGTAAATHHPMKFCQGAHAGKPDNSRAP